MLEWQASSAKRKRNRIAKAEKEAKQHVDEAEAVPREAKNKYDRARRNKMSENGLAKLRENARVARDDVGRVRETVTQQLKGAREAKDEQLDEALAAWQLAKSRHEASPSIIQQAQARERRAESELASARAAKGRETRELKAAPPVELPDTSGRLDEAAFRAQTREALSKETIEEGPSPIAARPERKPEEIPVDDAAYKHQRQILKDSVRADDERLSTLRNGLTTNRGRQDALRSAEDKTARSMERVGRANEAVAKARAEGADQAELDDLRARGGPPHRRVGGERRLRRSAARRH